MRLFVVLGLFVTSTFAQFVKPETPAGNQNICFKKVCNAVGKWECRDEANRRQLLDACKRQLDSNCLRSSFNKLPKSDTDEVHEVVSLARSCQYVQSGATQLSSRYMNSFETDEHNEVVRHNDAHWLVSRACINDAQGKLRSRFEVDNLEETNRLARFCQGTYEQGCLNNICDGSSFSCDELDEVVEKLRYCVHAPTPQDRLKL